MALRYRYRVPTIPVVRGARSFGRDHRSSQRIVRRAARPECRTIRRLLQSLEHLCTNALCGLIRSHSFCPKNAVCVEFSIFLPEIEAALRNSDDPSPFPVTHLEHFRQYLLSSQVSLVGHRPYILVLDCCPPFFELRHQHQDGF